MTTDQKDTSTTTETTFDQGPEQLPFQAETKQVLHLMVHSLYTNKDVFLRELITNASDALDKLRFIALTDHELSARTSSPTIRIEIDAERKTISVHDNGIGMTRQEAISNLGTIARSGTMEFLKKVQQAQDSKGDFDTRLIGQFGVGFYSAFIVAKRVDVQTLCATDPNAQPVLWRSDGEGSFTVSKGDRTEPGTSVVVHLKGTDNDDLLEPFRIEQLVKKYTDFVSYPIMLGDKILNQSTALWARSKTDITDEQYDSFYAHLQGGMDPGKPLARIHFSADAPLQYHVLLFVPRQAPIDLMLQSHKSAIRLYAKRMLVMDGCDRLTPPYLQFLRGVVDSEDLPLNVSREVLQDNRNLDVIRKAIETQTLKALQAMADEEPDDYEVFWTQFGRLFRLGVSTDMANQQAIAKLLRYPSTQTQDDKTVSLQQYVDRMKPGQKAIYYLTGANLKALRSSPHLEVFKKKQVEVLLMHDAVDEWVVGALFSFGDKSLESVAHGQVDLSDIADAQPDESAPDQAKDTIDPSIDACVERVQNVLSDKVKQVRVSSRLTTSAACLVSDQGDVSVHAERVIRMLDQEVKSPKRILELNPHHPVVKNLAKIIAKTPNSPQVRTLSELLLDQAMLAEGVVPDPSSLLERLQQVMTSASERVWEDSSSNE